MAEYIDREAAIEEIEKREYFMLGNKTIHVEAMKTFIRNRPAADVAPVRPELRNAVKELHKQYERAINSPAVRNPLAWALYRTWVMMDGEADEK